jgi:hypothetical protein
VRHTLTALGVLVMACVASEPSVAEEDAFEANLKAAVDNRLTIAGTEYTTRFEKEYAAGFADRLNECGRRMGTMPSDPFDVLLRLGASGSVDEALVRPSSPFAECYVALCKKAKYPVPPSDGYWVVARMRFSRQ